MNKIKNFLEKQNIKYKKLDSYELPFSHSSYTHENLENDESYERLEFLGDSILGSIVAEYLYINFPMYDQGDMTLMKHYVVNKEFLSMIAKEIKLAYPLKLGASFQELNYNQISDSIFEDVFESLIGAIYLDAGYTETKKFIYKHITSKLDNISIDDVKDPKTKLQELLQSDNRGFVVYETSNFSGKDSLFSSEVFFDKVSLGKGKGSSKKESEKNAAQDALERMSNVSS